MKLEILSPEKILFDDEVDAVQVPGKSGKFQMLNNHMPIVSSLQKGVIKIVDKTKKETTIEINAGVVEMKSNKIIILAQ